MASTAAQAAFNSGWSIRTPHLVSNKFDFRSWATNTSLGTLSAEALRELESIMSIADYDAGDILFLEQETLSRVFVIVSGDVRLSLQDLRGRRLTLRIARPGAILGMHSTLFESPSEWSADALYPSRIASISRSDFLRFAQRHPEVHRLATAELMTILRHACTTLRIVGLSSCIRKRLASQLLEWGERGNKTGDQTQFCMALTHAQIAEFIGAVRETVSRAMTSFKERGLVEIRGCTLRIPSTTALRKYAERG
jgi:CRP/FNR family transcriptional regulator, cyclic AMP receptor protein